MLSRVQSEGAALQSDPLAPKITEIGQDHWRSSSVKITHHQDCGSPQSFQRKALEPKNSGSRISDYAKIQLRVGFSDNSQPYFRFLLSAIKAVIVNY